ncbi:PH domain-containing protein [Halorubellus salinus]|uniref:PH domain-containing protein n=1 Tax=Halorubellus salinus TaxID=755309 RepID=UPI001D06FF94|nr:PH domain-containing protein [Halorubellus salinus]
METLHGRVRLQWSLRALILAAVLAGLAYGATLLLEWLPQVPLVVGAFTVVAVLGVAHAFAHYRRWRFDLEADAIYLVRGVVTHVDTAVPYVRVQHVDTQRTPLDRALGISRVVVYTAGSRGADVTIPGLTVERARTLRNELRELAVDAEPDDAV